MKDILIFLFAFLVIVVNAYFIHKENMKRKL